MNLILVSIVLVSSSMAFSADKIEAKKDKRKPANSTSLACQLYQSREEATKANLVCESSKTDAAIYESVDANGAVFLACCPDVSKMGTKSPDGNIPSEEPVPVNNPYVPIKRTGGGGR